MTCGSATFLFLTPRSETPSGDGDRRAAALLRLDPAVAEWWRKKADEIYGLIPDFGGFLVKANSEGQPGPQDYKRTHADARWIRMTWTRRTSTRSDR